MGDEIVPVQYGLAVVPSDSYLCRDQIEVSGGRQSKPYAGCDRVGIFWWL